MEYNKFLFRLYGISPPRFRNYIRRLILSREGGQMYSPTIRAIYQQRFNIRIGYGSYGGCFNRTNVPKNVVFGNYCSIAKNIRIFRANHPKNTFTTHPILYNPIAGHVKKDLLDRPQLVVGHDVWIGEGAIILPSVKSIHNGAIIGAGSIVTKDVPAYTIVAGNPAKKIGDRFESSVIEKLEESKWWELKKDELVLKIAELNIITGAK